MARAGSSPAHGTFRPGEVPTGNCLTLPVTVFRLTPIQGSSTPRPAGHGRPDVTKKEIVKQISERANLTQLKTKEIVQWTFDAIVETLIEEGRIELRNFGVF